MSPRKWNKHKEYVVYIMNKNDVEVYVIDKGIPVGYTLTFELDKATKYAGEFAVTAVVSKVAKQYPNLPISFKEV